MVQHKQPGVSGQTSAATRVEPYMAGGATAGQWQLNLTVEVQLPAAC